MTYNNNLYCIVSIILLIGSTIAVSNKKFPKNFKFGAATSAYQIEGGWNTDGKGENIWDYYVHNFPQRINKSATGDIACDSYHKYLEDVELIQGLGVNFYRFSLSWARILPDGFISNINQAGVDYYKNLIKALKSINVEPFVTIYHWDLPQKLQEAGGWPNSALENYYADYARLVFELFGNDVKYWATFNEPSLICDFGYGNGIFAPGYNVSGVANYMCAHTVIKSHARAYHIYNNEFRWRQHGKLTFVVESSWYEPATNSSEDLEAAERLLQFNFGLYAHPVYHPFGNYPKIVRELVEKRSKLEGFPQSRLPKLTRREIAFIRGTYDFMGLNSYTTFLAQSVDEAPVGTPSRDIDVSAIIYSDPKWESTVIDYFKVVPWGFRKLLSWVNENYRQPEILICENGYSDNGTLEDDRRINFHREYLSNTLEAIHEDGVNVIGYTVWSLLDNFEWTSGYEAKFGLYHVEFNNPNRTRTAKKSVKFYKTVIATKCLTDSCE